MKNASILTVAQQSVIAQLAAEQDIVRQFTLSGGTALAAFHLHHRRSDDLDFFSEKPVDDLRVRRFAEKVRIDFGAPVMEVRRIYDRHLFLIADKNGDQLKLEFTHYPYTPLESPIIQGGIQVESLRDIATDKLAALLDRFEPKDYYDLYFLLRDHTTLQKLRADLQTKFHIIANPVQLGAAFARCRNLPILPHLLIPVSKEDVWRFFEKMAKDLKLEVEDDATV